MSAVWGELSAVRPIHQSNRAAARWPLHSAIGRQKGSVFGEELKDGRCDARRRTGSEPGHGYRVFGATRSSVTAVASDGSPPRARDGSLEGLLNQRNILEVGFEREWRAKSAPRKSASREYLGNRPKTVVVIQSHWPKNKAARQDLRLRAGPGGAFRTAELVTRFSTRSDLGPSLWFAFDEPEAALRNREAAFPQSRSGCVHSAKTLIP